jgi:DNA repair exonuclease SbcCD ATPase subunit
LTIEQNKQEFEYELAGLREKMKKEQDESNKLHKKELERMERELKQTNEALRKEDMDALFARFSKEQDERDKSNQKERERMERELQQKYEALRKEQESNQFISSVLSFASNTVVTALGAFWWK